MKKWIVVLRLAKLSISEIVSKARFIVTSMTGNPYFTSPTPTLSSILAAATALEDAAEDARVGSKEDTAVMNKRRDELDALLSNAGLYVQSVANNDPDIGDIIIYSAGMDVKHNEGGQPRTFKVFNTELPGRVRIRTASAGQRSGYEWEFSTDQNEWTAVDSTLQSATVIDGLISGTRYYFRVRALTKKGYGPWQDPISIIVT